MIRTITPTLARRIAITRQHLAGERLPANADGMLALFRDLGCVQVDPISAVARSHLLVLWSRLGNYDPADLGALLWKERRLFEYWAHCASIVLTEDYPIHNLLMRTHGKGDSMWSKRVREWIQANNGLLRQILRKVRRDGPVPARVIEEDGLNPRAWVSTGWTSGRNVSRMLDFLWMQGKIMVAGRSGLQKLWDLSERVLPDWTPRERLSEHAIVHRAAQRSLRALGVATPKQIEQHFIRGRYPNLKPTLAELEAGGCIERVHVEGQSGAWYVHADDVDLLDRLERDWAPRTALLSPFDNLICDRARTRTLFDFKYTVEIYTPEAKRQYGYYVLPILRGDRFIGRIDPTMDRANKRLTINAIYAEPDAPMDKQTARAIADAVESLAAFLGAHEITYTRRMPARWKIR
ncbi:MAG: YcaQ family DNA glycosylase [Chloroflexi bacterium]|nr:YcaQ family DNA glycosylase [Chloroflexota bacterium]